MQLIKLRNQLTKAMLTLKRQGYEFQCEADNFVAASSKEIEELEAMIGELPPLLKSFYIEVGSLNFIGEHSEISDYYTDPVYFEQFDYLLERARLYVNDQDERDWFNDCYGGFALEISPDYFHKANVSGGPCYRIAIPNQSDPVIAGLEGEPKLSEYLAVVAEYNGLPGLRNYDLNWPEDRSDK